ncbi:M23 family metallopeptidase [Psychroserpens algicola]|uniref:M23 family metallopeptidase n=1 Tax=Psychroserpens algicola TaxID=1719034 RepID=A0ABT0H9W1_9FLAO|nr:M23 family metallopeptidase [Psychroserpens algicola]MCK8481136.1 M23 family metallopeptidase [Psychroserpens algicola]
MKVFLVCMFLSFITSSCVKQKPTNETVVHSDSTEMSVDSAMISEVKANYIKLFNEHLNYSSDGFDFPVGKPNADGYYNAQKFQENNHLGDDWNGVKGGNSDLGDPIYSVSNGYISEVKDYEGGWGNVIRIIHQHQGKYYESLYAHCDTIMVQQGTFIKKGTQIATIGNCNGYYLAHLHLEIRDEINLDIGPGYSSNTNGYLDPTDFINKNRN